ATVTIKAAHRGEHEVSRKTIARGKPGCPGCTCGLTRVLSIPDFPHTGLRAQSAPGFPCALFQGEGQRDAKLGRKRGAGMNTDVSPSLRAKLNNPPLPEWRHGLLRGACHRARVRATRRLAMTALS